jgi:salicylate hydroxylase
LSARTIVIAGAGIGGLTAALALAQRGFRVELLDRAEALEDVGAGIQLSPNATRVLTGLGLHERLSSVAVAPQAGIIRTARGREIARIPLAAAETRYGAPYWIFHRADLQAALLAAVRDHRDVVLTLGVRIEDFAVHASGVAVHTVRGLRGEEIQGLALVGADGFHSVVRSRLVRGVDRPSFSGRAAWRALMPADAVSPEFRAPAVQLWLGRGRHLVHYPVRAGAMINVVAIAPDHDPRKGEPGPASQDDVLALYPPASWGKAARDLLGVAAQWRRHSLYTRPALRNFAGGPITLLGDAAHPMLPYLAQGAAMAIEDAAVLANCIAASPDETAAAMRRYERARVPRTGRVQQLSSRNDTVFHLAWPASAARNWTMGRMGSEALLARYDWIYGWRPE